MYIPTNVAKPANSAGGGSPKDPNVAIIRIKDIATYPARDSKGVLIVGNFVLKPGAQAIRVYMTPSKIKASFEPDGDEDAQTFKHKFEGEHPGDSLAVNEFVQNYSGEPCIIISESCSDNFKKVTGTKCAPMYLKPSGQDENDSRKHMLVFEQYAKTNHVPAHYTGQIPTVAPFPVVDSLEVPVNFANGFVYQLPNNNDGDDILFSTLFVDHGDVITLLGGGGTSPCELKVAGSTVRKPMLVNGVSWIGIQGSFINLMIFDNGSETFAVEVSRG